MKSFHSKEGKEKKLCGKFHRGSFIIIYSVTAKYGEYKYIKSEKKKNFSLLNVK